MTITQQDELDALKHIGQIVADTLKTMSESVEAGMTTRELDAIGRALLEKEGAISAPESEYEFPGATCISINEEIAHGIPSDRVIAPGDMINIDVSASKNGFFGDTGASFRVAPLKTEHDKLCKDGRRAMEIGIAQVQVNKPLGGIGNAIGRFARRGGYTLIRNLASHGVGRSLHEYPEEIATWPTRDKRRITKGMVLTVEPFLSTGGHYADDGEDGWTLYSEPTAPCVQYEHTVVATDRGPVILTLPSR